MQIKINVSLSTINWIELQIETLQKSLEHFKALNQELIDAQIFDERFYSNKRKQEQIALLKAQYEGQLEFIYELMPLSKMLAENGINHIVDHTNNKYYLTNPTRA
jgi:hypothetical protein